MSQSQPQTLFKYHRSMIPTDDTETEFILDFPELHTYRVKTATFNIGRWGQLTNTITFAREMTGEEALAAIELWLSQPLTQDELDTLKRADDLYDENEPLTWYENRGRALGACVFLDNIHYDSQTNHITLSCGS